MNWELKTNRCPRYYPCLVVNSSLHCSRKMDKKSLEKEGEDYSLSSLVFLQLYCTLACYENLFMLQSNFTTLAYISLII